MITIIVLLFGIGGTWGYYRGKVENLEKEVAELKAANETMRIYFEDKLEKISNNVEITGKNVATIAGILSVDNGIEPN